MASLTWPISTVDEGRDAPCAESAASISCRTSANQRSSSKWSRIGTKSTRSRSAPGSARRIISARSCQLKGFFGERAWKAEPITTATRGAASSAFFSRAWWALWKGWKRPMRTARSCAAGGGHGRILAAVAVASAVPRCIAAMCVMTKRLWSHEYLRRTLRCNSQRALVG